ncbi:MAG: hypothetical protein NTU53_11270 [Planctomycetota bacterium]|nr:hypothetical protein [Planctomycetota bacterium]
MIFDVPRHLASVLVLLVLPLIVPWPLSAQSPAGSNVLPNPSFAENAADSVRAWKSRAWSGSDNARWAVDSRGRTGKQCASIQWDKGSDAAWTATVNRHPSKPVVCTVRMKDALLEGKHEAIVLAGDSPDAFNDVEHPNRVVPERVHLTFGKGDVRLPPHSLSNMKVLVKP